MSAPNSKGKRSRNAERQARRGRVSTTDRSYLKGTGGTIARPLSRLHHAKRKAVNDSEEEEEEERAGASDGQGPAHRGRIYVEAFCGSKAGAYREKEKIDALGIGREDSGNEPSCMGRAAIELSGGAIASDERIGCCGANA